MKVKLQLQFISLGILFCAAVLVVLTVLAAVWHTYQAVTGLQHGQVAKTASHVRAALPVVQALNTFTLKKQPDLLVWESVLYSLESVQPLTQLVPQYLQQALSSDASAAASANALLLQLQAAQIQLGRIQHQLPQTLLVKRLLSSNQQKTLSDSVKAIDDLEKMGEMVLTGNHTYFILFQNSDELRATGGFMGSYQRVSLQNGAVTDLKIEDIYQPAGQVTAQQTPPAGVKEYLSSGNSWGLPDSNWDPDFPTAAPIILQFFAAGKEAPADGLIAINLALAEQLLDITGEIYLPDAGVTVTSQNLSSLARADRSQFFPGSRQKQNFLGSLFSQLKIKLTQLTPAQQLRVVQLLQKAIQTKALQAYSRDSTLQNLITKYQLAGAVPSRYPFIFPVESNVGINKANREVTRNYQLLLGSSGSQLTINFENHNQSQPDPQKPNTNLGNYINYQRLLLPADSIIQTILINDQAVTKWDETTLITSGGAAVKQVGFLVPVPAQQKATVVIQFQHPEKAFWPQLTFVHQSGVPASPLIVVTPEKNQTFTLDSDQTILTAP